MLRRLLPQLLVELAAMVEKIGLISLGWSPSQGDERKHQQEQKDEDLTRLHDGEARDSGHRTQHLIWFEGQKELALRHEVMKARQARQAARKQYTEGSRGN